MLVMMMVMVMTIDVDDVGEAIKDADLDLEANIHSPLRGLQGTFFKSLLPRKDRSCNAGCLDEEGELRRVLSNEVPALPLRVMIIFCVIAFRELQYPWTRN